MLANLMDFLLKQKIKLQFKKKRIKQKLFAGTIMTKYFLIIYIFAIFLRKISLGRASVMVKKSFLYRISWMESPEHTYYQIAIIFF